MKSLFIALFLLTASAFQYSAFSQSKDSARIFADITSSEKISLPESYKFTKSLTLIHTSGVNTDKSEITYLLRYPDNQSYLAMTITGFTGEKLNTMPEILVDFEEDKIITFMDFPDSKMAMIRSLEESENVVAILNGDYRNLLKSGKTKKILGYQCHQYSFNDNGLIGNLWLTESISIEFAPYFSSLGLLLKKDDNATVKGYILRLESSNSTTGEIQHLVVKKLDLKSPYKIDAESYAVTSMPSN